MDAEFVYFFEELRIFAGLPLRYPQDNDMDKKSKRPPAKINSLSLKRDDLIFAHGRITFYQLDSQGEKTN